MRNEEITLLLVVDSEKDKFLLEPNSAIFSMTVLGKSNVLLIYLSFSRKLRR